MIAGAMYAAFLTNSLRDVPCFDISLATFVSTRENVTNQLPSYHVRNLTDQQIQLLQSPYNRGYVIQHHLLVYVKFLRKQSRNPNGVRDLLPVLPDEACGFIKLMNLIEFRVQQQQVLLDLSQDKAIPPLDRSCHRTPELDSEVIMELPNSEESVCV